MNITAEQTAAFDKEKELMRVKLRVPEKIKVDNKYKIIRDYTNQTNKENNKDLANNICKLSKNSDWELYGEVEYIRPQGIWKNLLSVNLPVTPDITCVRSGTQVEYDTLINSKSLDPLGKFCLGNRTKEQYMTACECMTAMELNASGIILNKINTRLNASGIYINDITNQMHNKKTQEWTTLKNNENTRLNADVRWSECYKAEGGGKDGWCKNTHGSGWRQINESNDEKCTKGVTSRAECIRDDNKRNLDLSEWIKQNPAPIKISANETINRELQAALTVSCCSNYCNQNKSDGASCKQSCDQKITTETFNEIAKQGIDKKNENDKKALDIINLGNKAIADKAAKDKKDEDDRKAAAALLAISDKAAKDKKDEDDRKVAAALLAMTNSNKSVSSPIVPPVVPPAAALSTAPGDAATGDAATGDAATGDAATGDAEASVVVPSNESFFSKLGKPPLLYGVIAILIIVFIFFVIGLFFIFRNNSKNKVIKRSKSKRNVDSE